MTMDAMLMAHNEDLVRELSGQMERYAAMATEVEHLRDLVARLMEALRAPIGWPTTEAAMMKHARRAGAALEAQGEELHRLRAELAMLSAHNEDLVRDLAEQMERYNTLVERMQI